ncbi:unnamed protein product [Larinioides sclopetarius]|uniref:Uncharacterized protein n=1 Tax=Larinioides sclopetarius TaxID=280406 RepID=A0AAV1ZXL5_9ARAC
MIFSQMVLANATRMKNCTNQMKREDSWRVARILAANVWQILLKKPAAQLPIPVRVASR